MGRRDNLLLDQTAVSYFGRVSNEPIVQAVREGASEQAAQNIVRSKKQAMAEAAEAARAAFFFACGSPFNAVVEPECCRTPPLAPRRLGLITAVPLARAV